MQEFREDLKRMLGINFAGTVLRWDGDFEVFLKEEKRCERVLTEGGLAQRPLAG